MVQATPKVRVIEYRFFLPNFFRKDFAKLIFNLQKTNTLYLFFLLKCKYAVLIWRIYHVQNNKNKAVFNNNFLISYIKHLYVTALYV